MTKINNNKISLFLIFSLVFTLALVLTFSITTGISYAEETAIETSSIQVGHISDLHYFPYLYCYTDSYRTDNEKYESTDFFDCMTGDTKNVLESGLTLTKSLKCILDDAKANKAPHYFVVSGDLCKNGERVALIDVANALRWLQNNVRKITGYEDFQIFVTTGNHDLYNEAAELYDSVLGSGYKTDVVSAKEFALIFAGLGFPNAEVNHSKLPSTRINLLDYFSDESYWSTSYTGGYIQSDNSTYVTITYYNDALQTVNNGTSLTSQEKIDEYLNIGDTNNKLSYYVKVNGTDFSLFMLDASEKEEILPGEGGFQRISQVEWEKSFNGKQTEFAKRNFYVSESTLISDTDTGESCYINKVIETPLTMEEVNDAFASSKTVYVTCQYNHICGGKITENVLSWMNEISNTLNSSTHEETIIASFHMNLLPHWEEEAAILKDFVIYNYEYVTKTMLQMGIRYVYTGHQHASDVMSYTDVEGRTMFDMETGSMVSYDSPRRYTTITRYDCDGSLGETFESNLYVIDSIKEIADTLVSTAVWNQSTFDTAYANYISSPTDANWQSVLNTNLAFSNYIIKYEELSVLTFDEYINYDLYDRLVERVVSHIINNDLIDTLKGLVTGLFSGTNTLMTAIKSIIPVDDLTGVVNYLIDEIAYNLSDTYADGSVAGVDNTIIDYVLNVVDGIVNLEFGDDSIQSSVNLDNKGKLTLAQMAQYIMTSHSGCLEINLCKTQAELQAEYANIDAEGWEETDCSTVPLPSTIEEEYRYRNPLDKTYRKRMTAAVYDVYQLCHSGDFVEFLFYALFAALYDTDQLNGSIVNNEIYKSLPEDHFFKTIDQDKSILKLLLEKKFDLSDAVTKGYITQNGYKNVESLFKKIPDLLPIVSSLINIKINQEVNIDPTNIVLVDLIDSLMPLLKTLLSSLIGFTISGDTLYEALDNAISGYITRSFEVGLGGIASDIIVSYSTDVYPDLTMLINQSGTFLYEPYIYAKTPKNITYGGKTFTYVSNQKIDSSVENIYNPATQDNGRVPSRLTSNFDNANPTTSYTIKFYTAEEIYADFVLMDANGKVVTEVSTSAKNAATPSINKFNKVTNPYKDSSNSVTKGNIKIDILTQTKPQYVPLIDLGILCLTHGEIADEDDNPYTCLDRDSAQTNSVIFYNVTTVTITGLKADTEYKYDVKGTYVKEDGTILYFSLADFSNVSSFKIKTAKATNSTDEFSFLTIADIQGMIESMYEDSYSAVDAILKDSNIMKNVNFFINAGDMCDNPKNFDQWAWACNTYMDLFANYSQFFTAGNHENGTTAMTDYFNYSMPIKNQKTNETYQSDTTGGVYYSFDYGNVHITVLNTNDTSSKGISDAQLSWLKDDLKKSKATWKIVLMHKSLYSAGSHSYDEEVVAMRKQLVPIFAQYGVSMVFAGHDHTYTTTCLLDSKGNIVENMADENGSYVSNAGTLYITLGTMGTKFYEYTENPITAQSFDNDNSIKSTLNYQTFGKVTINGKSLSYTAYKYENNSIKEISSISLTKEDTALIDAAKASIKVTSIDVKKTAAGLNNEDIITFNSLPAGYSIVFVSNGETYTNISDVPINGKSSNVEIYMVDRNSTKALLGNVTINNSYYNTSLALKIGIPSGIGVLIIVIVVVIIIAKKKKK